MILYKDLPIEDIDEKAGIVKGYGSIFGNKDSDDDIIERGAYTKTIQEHGNRVRYLWQHDITRPIGKMRELEEDEKGLRFVAEIPKTTFGNDVIELMKFGVITENSVGILPILKDYNEETKTRHIKEVKLYEISAVTLASNDQAMINEIKSSQKKQEELNKKFYAVKTLLKEGKISDELGLAIDYQLQCIKSEMNAEKPDAESTLSEKKINDSEVYKYMFNLLNKTQ